MAGPNGKKGGRPKIEIDLDILRKLCLLQCTDRELAAFFGCSVETIDKRKQSDPHFLQVYEKGKEEGKTSLRRLQFRHAEKNATMAIFLGKQYLGQRDERQITGRDGDPIALTITAADMTDDQLADIASRGSQGATRPQNGSKQPE